MFFLYNYILTILTIIIVVMNNMIRNGKYKNGLY